MKSFSSPGGGPGGVSTKMFAAGIASAALAGYGIGVGVPALFAPQVADEKPTPAGKPTNKPKTVDPARHGMVQDATQEEIVQMFKLESSLAHGGTATVWRAVERGTGREVAIKVINKARVNPDVIAREIDALQRCSGSPHVIALHAVYDVAADEANPDGEWHMVMELAQGGELLEWVQRHPMYTEKVAAQLMQQAAAAVQHMHSKQIVHRDVKPENLVLSAKDPSAQLKLVDFGAAASFKKGLVEGKAGTWTYWAPEQAERRPHDEKVDIWGLGVVLFILLSGRHPFQQIQSGARTLDEQATMSAILKCEYSFDAPEWNGVSEDARNLVQQLLVLDPRQRLTADQLMSHPWICGDLAPESSLPWWTNALPLYKKFPSFWRLRKPPKDSS